MSERRVFVQASCEAGGRYRPDAAGLHYVQRVLRAEVGEVFRGFDADGNAYRLEWAPESDGFLVLEKHPPAASADRTIALAQGIPKGPKIDLVLRQCTEAGVSAFFPLLTERTVVRLEPEEREGKRIRWERVLQEACRQCGRDDLPELFAPLPFGEMLSFFSSFDLVLILDAGEGAPLKRLLEDARPRRVLLLVGPEGGWSPQERDSALEKGARVAHLPTPVLRTETAPLAAVSMIQYYFH